MDWPPVPAKGTGRVVTVISQVAAERGDDGYLRVVSNARIHAPFGANRIGTVLHRPRSGRFGWSQQQRDPWPWLTVEWYCGNMAHRPLLFSRETLDRISVWNLP
jgi:hypothetical protein